MSAHIHRSTQPAFGVKVGWKRQNTQDYMGARDDDDDDDADADSGSCRRLHHGAARQKHLDPRVNIVNWQRGQQLLNDLNNTCTQGRLF